MNRPISIIAIASLCCLIVLGGCDEDPTIDLMNDNPQTLIGTSAVNFELNGIQLGMTRDQVQDVVNSWAEVSISINAGSDTVSLVTAASANSDNPIVLMDLDWYSGPTLARIAILHDAHEMLSPAFAQMLDPEATDADSETLLAFLGIPSDSHFEDDTYHKIQTTRNEYDNIGVSVSRFVSEDAEIRVLSLFDPVQ